MFDDELRTPRPRQRPAAEPHRALYLRWRPKRFQDVVGQEHVTRTLRNASSSGRLGHAYLFTGPRGTGKTSVARILFRAANCDHLVDGDPCNVCPTCLGGLDGSSLDLVEIDAASNRGIDDVRDLRDKVAYRPSSGPLPAVHPGRGARVHDGGLGRVPEDARGAAGACHLRAGYDRGAQGAGDDRLALPALRLPPHPLRRSA